MYGFRVFRPGLSYCLRYACSFFHVFSTVIYFLAITLSSKHYAEGWVRVAVFSSGESRQAGQAVDLDGKLPFAMIFEMVGFCTTVDILSDAGDVK